jgi:hypothetical protein
VYPDNDEMNRNRGRDTQIPGSYCVVCRVERAKKGGMGGQVKMTGGQKGLKGRTETRKKTMSMRCFIARATAVT